MFVGLNPATTNETADDPTIRRVISLAKIRGYGGVYMLNCFPYVTTNPADLREFGNTDLNNDWLYETAPLCEEIIFAWGSFAVVKELGRDVELTTMFPTAKALIINKDGSPRHPLYVPSSVVPVMWKLSS